ncbi:MAG TPA: COX15/CtaA family protein [bacterium]|nr:COX15/CtaA family protein [bacterium]
MSPSEVKPLFHPRLHLYALVTSGCTFLLLLAGALVTSTGSSLAVPDWPLSFGKFFPEMRGGVLFEHGHRMVAGTVSFLMLGLAITTQLVEERRWVKGLAWTAMGAILLQAVLGGVTVLLKLPTQVSVAHAGLAQIFFCLIVSLALVTSRGWVEEIPHRLDDRPSPIKPWAAWSTGLIYLQILLGAVTRHSGSGLAIPDYPLSFGQLLPPDWSPSITLQFSHTRVGAFIVILFVTHTAYRACFHFTEEKGLFWPAAAAGLFVWMQFLLGLLVIFTQKSIIPTSVHVIIGAATLASMLTLTLKCYQLFKKD